ncbi:MAG: DUF1761 domain-containing protein, partial [Bacteroidota bacterium]|nr:DUF1761 domain-containing protein [Bacteroidota bacterium]
MYEINYLAVLVASLFPMLIGSLWYGPLFGKRWMALVEKSEEELRASFNPVKSYAVTWVFALLMAFVMAHVIDTWSFRFGDLGVMGGIQTGFWIWIGFVLTIGWQRVAFEDVKTALWTMN